MCEIVKKFLNIVRNFAKLREIVESSVWNCVKYGEDLCEISNCLSMWQAFLTAVGFGAFRFQVRMWLVLWFMVSIMVISAVLVEDQGWAQQQVKTGVLFATHVQYKRLHDTKLTWHTNEI